MSASYIRYYKSDKEFGSFVEENTRSKVCLS